MNLTWEESFKIRTYDVDFNDKVKLSSIFNFMQEAATNHADHLNVGFKELLEEGLFWVLSRVIIEVVDFPRLGDKIKVETWPKGTNKLFALRDFKIYNSENEVIAKATTAWLMIDSEKMRPQRPKVFVEKIPYFRDTHALLELPVKIQEPQMKDVVFNKKVRYTDVDINNHMNNVKYVELVIDSFCQNTFKEKQIHKMQINFLSECRFEDEIQVLKGNFKDSKDYFYIEGVNSNTNNKVFNTSIKWIEKLG